MGPEYEVLIRLAARRMLSMYYTYVLLSLKDRRFYTGYTSDLRKRLGEHNKGETKIDHDSKTTHLNLF